MVKLIVEMFMVELKVVYVYGVFDVLSLGVVSSLGCFLSS